MKLNWDGPHMPLLAPMLVVPAGGDGVDVAAAGAAAANEVPPPPSPPAVLPTHTSSSTPRPSTAAHDTPVRDPTPVMEPTSVRKPTPKDISEDGGGYVSLPKSNEAPPTTASTAVGGAEDSVALTDLSLKLDSTSLGGDTTIEAAYTIYKASQDAHASSDASPDEDEVPDTTNMSFRHTISAGAGNPADAQTIPAGSTPIPTTGGVSGGSFMDPAGQAAAAAPAPSSSAIPAVDKGKA
nr:hypothetical protein [Tanacetum cinerariifolium]